MGEKISIAVGVKQGCILSPLLFNIVLDVALNRAFKEPLGIQWGLLSRLEDLDYADDLCIFSHSHSDMSQKLLRLQEEANNVGLQINVAKTKEMRSNTPNNQDLYLSNRAIERVDEFQYLGSMVHSDGGTEKDIEERILKAQRAFGMLTPVWNSSIYSKKTKVQLFNSNVKSILLYGCETWKVTRGLMDRLQVFVNKCLRRILRIFWPNQINNEELWRRTSQNRIDIEIKKRKWGWIGHILRRPHRDIARQALEWNPQGRRARGRPRNTWRRTVTSEAQEVGKTWGEIKQTAQNRIRWKHLLEALCPTKG